jgi:5-methylcytosine-specific restriction endonuclease McrA
MPQSAEARAEYMRKYRATNRAAIRAKARAWEEANTTARQSRDRSKYLAEYRAANREELRESNKMYYAVNKDARADYMREYCADNRHLRAIRDAEWQRNNPDKVAAKNAARRARRINATPSWLTEEDHHEILKFYTEAQRLNHHVDHIVPLKGKNVSGLHVPWNLQVLPPHENRSKSNHH